MALTRESKIAIIGAGPAGTHMAYLLSSKGFKNIKIFEKNNRIGGKSFTIMHDNVPHEMGACYITASYSRIGSLMEKMGIEKTAELTPELRHAFVDGGIIKTQQHVPNMMVDIWANSQIKCSVKIMQLLKKVFDHIPIIGRPFSFIVHNIMKYNMVQDLIGAIKDYMHYMDDLKQSSEHDVPNIAYEKYGAIFSSSIHSFLKERGWDVMSPIFMLLYTVMCYGYLHTSPAYYGTYWMCKPYLQTYLNFLMGKPAHNNSVMLSEGFQTLWERTAAASSAKIHYNATIQKIYRDDKKVRIALQDAKEEEFDYIISAIPAPDMISLLDKKSEFEQRIFGNMMYSIVVTTLLEVESKYDKAGVIYWLDRLSQPKEDLVFAARTAASIIQGRHNNQQTLVTYQYYDNPETFDEERSEKKLTESFEGTGIVIKNAVHKSIWKYFYRFSAEDIKQGVPWMIDEMQGDNNTLYIGSSVSFESVNAVVNYNHYAYEKFIRPDIT